MKLKKSFVLAIVLALMLLTVWELYLRSNMESITMIADDKALWAVQRAEVEHLTEDDIVLTGSSRVLFDIQLDVWEEKTGLRPVQLACAGSSPLPVFHDLVANTDFAGTILVGVTPGLFFSTTYPKAEPWEWPQSRVDHYKDRTYADRSNHWLSLPLQKSFYFVSAEEDDTADNVDLKALVDRVQWGDRARDDFPPFHQFGVIETDRNLRMSNLCATDTAFARKIKNVWQAIMGNPNGPRPDVKGTSAFFLKDAAAFTERGGTLILFRAPSTGMIKELETKGLPRATHWDSLVVKSKAYSYHYEDYQGLTGFDCPEWSHLSGPDADIFTGRLVDIMLEDGVITKSNNQ